MARAILRRFRESPRKVRVVADMIRGRSVDDALVDPAASAAQGGRAC